MTQHIDVYTTNSTISLPSNLVSANLAVTAIGGTGDPLIAGAYVQGQLAPSLFPLTVYVGQIGTNLTGGAGYSGGGGGYASGGGSTAVLSGSTLLIEAGGADGVTASGPTPGGSGGGYASNTPVNGSVDGAGSGGSQGGNGGAQAARSVTGGAGVGGGTNGNAASGSTSGAGVGSGGLSVPGRAASFAASPVIGFQYGVGPNPTTSGPGSVTVVYNVADAPSAPPLVSPAASSFADTNANGITLVGTYVTPGSDTGSLVGVAVSLKIDGGTVHYWNGTNFSSTTPVYLLPSTGVGAVNGEQFSAVIPPGVLADGHVYTWGLSCQESFANLKGAFSTTQNFTGAVAPSAVITFPTASPVTSLSPSMTWTPTTPAGSQTAFRVVLYDAPTTSPGSGSPFYDSGVHSTATASLSLSGIGLHSVTTYYGYLQITETGGQTSQWTPFVMTVQLVDSATPTLSGRVTTEPQSGCPAPLLTATTSGGTASPNIEFQASYDGGNTWNDILGLVPGGSAPTSLVTPTSGSAEIYDMGAPFNVAVQYRCRNIAVSGGETFVSAWSTVLSHLIGADELTNVDSLYWWMVSPSDPSMAIQLKRIRSTVATSSASTSDTAVTMPAMPAGLSASLIIDEPEQQGRFNGFGRPDAIVIHGDIWDEEFVLNVYFDGEAEFQAFRAIRNLQQPVLLKSDMSGDLYWVTLGGARPAAILSESNRQADPKRGLSIQCIPAAPVLP